MANKLWAIADLHLSYKSNREEWTKLRAKGVEDGLVLAGDGTLSFARVESIRLTTTLVGESISTLNYAFETAKKCFRHVFWVPGNHELYTLASAPEEEQHLRGEAKYMACVDAARKHGVLTPEDEYMTWRYVNEDGTRTAAVICPIFTLYDYSFRPDDITREGALDWAMQENIRATDESLLWPTPYASRDEWCHKLVAQGETKLQRAADSGLTLVIINHWPLREDIIYIPRVPRFTLWCGTKKTKDWHKTYGAKVVVSGHLHVPRTDWIDGVRFEEVSLGYSAQWKAAKDLGMDVNTLLREILPGPPSPPLDQVPATAWRRRG